MCEVKFVYLFFKMVKPNSLFYYKYTDGCDGNIRLNQINYDEHKLQLENLMKLTPN